MSRTPLPTLRPAITMDLVHKGPHGDRTFPASFGFDRAGYTREAFAKAEKSGSEFQALIQDGCTLMSILAQHGMSFSEIASRLGENRGEGEKSGPPSSVLGTIARAGAELDLEVFVAEPEQHPQATPACPMDGSRDAQHAVSGATGGESAATIIPPESAWQAGDDVRPALAGKTMRTLLGPKNIPLSIVIIDDKPTKSAITQVLEIPEFLRRTKEPTT